MVPEMPAAPAPESNRSNAAPSRWPALLSLGVLLPLLMVAGLAAYSLVTTHEQDEDRATLLAQNLASALQYSVS